AGDTRAPASPAPADRASSIKPRWLKVGPPPIRGSGTIRALASIAPVGLGQILRTPCSGPVRSIEPAHLSIATSNRRSDPARRSGRGAGPLEASWDDVAQEDRADRGDRSPAADGNRALGVPADRLGGVRAGRSRDDTARGPEGPEGPVERDRPAQGVG